MVLCRQNQASRIVLRPSRCGHGLWVEQRRHSILGTKPWNLCRGVGPPGARGLEVCLVHWFGGCSSMVTALLSRVMPSQLTNHQMDAVHLVANSMKIPTGPGIGWSRSRGSSSSSLPS